MSQAGVWGVCCFTPFFYPFAPTMEPGPRLPLKAWRIPIGSITCRFGNGGMQPMPDHAGQALKNFSFESFYHKVQADKETRKILTRKNAFVASKPS